MKLLEYIIVVITYLCFFYFLKITTFTDIKSNFLKINSLALHITKFHCICILKIIILFNRNYARGQGFQLDPVDAALVEERRQKAQEYQQAIRLQMEEKQKRLQAERERKKLEEEAEEIRLEAERARIQKEYEEEQLRLKQKAVRGFFFINSIFV